MSGYKKSYQEELQRRNDQRQAEIDRLLGTTSNQWQREIFSLMEADSAQRQYVDARTAEALRELARAILEERGMLRQMVHQATLANEAIREMIDQYVTDSKVAQLKVEHLERKCRELEQELEEATTAPKQRSLFRR